MSKKETDKEPAFEEAMKKLEQIVMKMEKGDLTLEENIKFFEEGNKLAKLCAAQLEQAEKKVEVLLGKKSDGEPIFKEIHFEEE